MSILVVEHEAQCPPGWLGEWLVGAGAQLDVRRPYAGEPLPEDLAAHTGLVVLGGEMGANDGDRFAWLHDVQRLVRVAADDAVPVLGVCLGHQLVAAALGGEAEVNPLGTVVGVVPVGWLPAAYDDPLLGSQADLGSDVVAVQWNNDVVTRLPDSAVELARNERGDLQAARFAPTAWGVQWHPEAGAELFGTWADHARDDAGSRGLDLDRHVADVSVATDRLRATWRLLAERFADLCATDRGLGAAPQ